MSPNCFTQIATVICKTCCGTFELTRAYTRTNILTVILTRINVGQYLVRNATKSQTLLCAPHRQQVDVNQRPT